MCTFARGTTSHAMLEAVPSGSVGAVPHHAKVQFSFRADFFRDGFHGLSVRVSVRNPTLPNRMSEKHTSGAPHGCACASISITKNMPIDVGSFVSTFLKTEVCGSVCGSKE